MDYTSTPITATFTASSTITTINIPVTVDNIVEESEMFDLSFTIPSSPISNFIVQGNVSKAIGNITDDTSKKLCLLKYLINILYSVYMISATMVNFSQAKYNFNENGGPAKPTLVLTNLSSCDIIIEVLSNNLTAFGKFYVSSITLL